MAEVSGESAGCGSVACAAAAAACCWRRYEQAGLRGLLYAGGQRWVPHSDSIGAWVVGEMWGGGIGSELFVLALALSVCLSLDRSFYFMMRGVGST